MLEPSKYQVNLCNSKVPHGNIQKQITALKMNNFLSSDHSLPTHTFQTTHRKPIKLNHTMFRTLGVELI